MAHDLEDLRKLRGVVFPADLVDRGYAYATIETHGDAAVRLASALREAIENPLGVWSGDALPSQTPPAHAAISRATRKFGAGMACAVSAGRTQ